MKLSFTMKLYHETLSVIVKKLPWCLLYNPSDQYSSHKSISSVAGDAVTAVILSVG